MASIVLAVSVLTYYSVKKIREHNEEKRALRELELGIIEVILPFDDRHEEPPVYQKNQFAASLGNQEHTALGGHRRDIRYFQSKFVRGFHERGS